MVLHISKIMSKAYETDIAKKFKNKYRIPSTRLSNYDYGLNGAYFVTICTKNRESFFGEIASDQMQLSDIGKICCRYWLEIPNHFPFIFLGEWMVMPNHIHGILIFETPKLETPKLGVSTKKIPITKNTNSNWKPGILGVIINQYKRACTIESRKINFGFTWQSRFYEHITRDENELMRISEYIRSNPHNWKNDDNY